MDYSSSSNNNKEEVDPPLPPATSFRPNKQPDSPLTPPKLTSRQQHRLAQHRQAQARKSNNNNNKARQPSDGNHNNEIGKTSARQPSHGNPNDKIGQSNSSNSSSKGSSKGQKRPGAIPGKAANTDLVEDQEKKKKKDDDTLRHSDIMAPPDPGARDDSIENSNHNDSSSNNQAAVQGQAAESNNDEVEALDAYLATDDNPKKRESSNLELIEGSIYKPHGETKEPTPTRQIILRVVLILVVAVVVIGSVIGIRDSDTNNNAAAVAPPAPQDVASVMPSQAPSTSAPSAEPTVLYPTQSPTEIPTSANLDLVLQDVQTWFGNWTCCLDDSTSPQYQAAQWMADVDEWMDFPINFDDLNEAAIFQQRYAYVVLYFATNGQYWRDSCNFLNPTTHVCDWNCNVSPLIFQQEGTIGNVLPINDTSMANYLGLFEDNPIHTKNGVLCVQEYPFSASNPGLELRSYGLRFVFNNLTGTIPRDLVAANIYRYNLQFNQLGGSMPFESVNDFVTTLRLEFNQFTGTIPPGSLERMYRLVDLTLEHNLLSGNIPTEMGYLTLLDRLRLNSNLLSGTIPWELAQLQGNFEFFLDDNQLTGTLPPSLLATNAWSVILDYNLLEGSLPDKLSLNTAMRICSLTGNQFTGPIPESIDQLSTLQQFYLDFNQFTGAIPASLGSLTNLGSLFLDGNNFVGQPLEDNSWLFNLQQMLILDLSTNHFSGTISPQIGDTLTQALVINLSNNQFEASIPSEIGRLENLFTLRLNNNTFTGNFPLEFDNGRSSFSNLRRFWLQHNDFAGDIDSQCERAINGNPPLMGTGLFDYQADCLEVDCTCCTSCCDAAGECGFV